MLKILIFFIYLKTKYKNFNTKNRLLIIVDYEDEYKFCNYIHFVVHELISW